MTYNFKIDVAYNACVLSGTISMKIYEQRVGLNALKEIYVDSDEFREIRNVFASGVRMCEKVINE